MYDHELKGNEMRAFRTDRLVVIEEAGKYYPVQGTWDDFVRSDDIFELARVATEQEAVRFDPLMALAPIVNQEVWAAGVTYYRSCDARMRESAGARGEDFYARVYAAPRPELFFKATGRRVVGSSAKVRIRSDANWSVAEPELTLLVNPEGSVVGYAVGNDMSSRDIEGENPLYLPQAKVYNGSCAIGPSVLLSAEPLPRSTAISIDIFRQERVVYSDSTTLHEMKRDPKDLVDYLFRDNSFPDGVFLMTGTGIIPPDEFTLLSGDEIRITISAIGTLVNHVA